MSSKIEWTQTTLNPMTGCSKISPGCKNCYAEHECKRLRSIHKVKYRNGFLPTFHSDVMEVAYTWRTPKMVFVNSMSDTFHEHYTDEQILSVFQAMNDNPKHIFQLLTKRPERLVEMSPDIKWTPNIWMGVSVENSRSIDSKNKPCVGEGK